ncbi:MAG: hypothetical protein PUB33_05105 [Ligilactobacillus ruminis]|nr:hypothetical protein [Ligilactobacillus ruminis]
MPQIEKPDDLQSIANLTRFFSYALQSPSMIEISQKICFHFHVSKRPKTGHCMYPGIAIYGQILKNGILPVSHLEALIEQAMHNAAFD